MSSNVISTLDYSQFKLLPNSMNRPVLNNRVEKLMKSIRSSNKLHVFPIVVTPRKEVIDGQHRLEAAKRLKTAIFYMVDHQNQTDDIIFVHANRFNWSMKDFVSYYSKKGLEEYTFVDDMYKTYCDLNQNFTIIFCTLKIFCFNEYGHISHALKNGKLKLKNKDQWVSFLENTFYRCKEISSKIKSPTKKLGDKIFFKQSYLHCLAMCFKYMELNEYKELWKCLDRDYALFTSTNTISEIAIRFKECYNRGKSKKHRFDFGEIWKFLSDDKPV